MAVWRPIEAWFGQLWDAVQQIFGGFVTFLGGVFTGDMDAAAAGLKQAWEGCETFFSTLWDGVRAVFATFAGWVAGPFGTDFGAAAEAVKRAWSSLGDWFDRFWGDIKGIFDRGWAAISPIIDALGGGVNLLAQGWNAVSGLFGDSAAPAAGAQAGAVAGSMVGAMGAGGRTDIRTVVDIRGLPPGSRVTTESRGAPVQSETNVGYSDARTW